MVSMRSVRLRGTASLPNKCLLSRSVGERMQFTRKRGQYPFQSRQSRLCTVAVLRFRPFSKVDKEHN